MFNKKEILDEREITSRYTMIIIAKITSSYEKLAQ